MEGTTAMITAPPRRRPSAARFPASASAGPRADGKPIRALVVDDDPSLLRAYERILRGAGVEAVPARNGAEAERALTEEPFDVVVSDIVMPSMGGMELLKRVRQRDPDVPVILVTGSPSVETAAEAVEHGALRYLFKPVDSRKLKETVTEAGRLFRLAKLERRARDLLPTDHSLADPSGLDRSFSRALDGIWIAYQPIVSWRERRVVAYEALCRSHEPELPHPGALIEAAEKLGRVHELGRRIRERAVAALPRMGDDTSLFLNLHPQDLLDDELVADPRLAARVVLEVTERSALDAVADVKQRVAALKRAGYRVAVDDLGAGYAGLSAFATLTPSVAKLDMSLVRDVDREPVKAQVVAGMIELCREMGTSVVVEGVETEAERDTLAACGCDLMQGFLFAKPSPDLVDPPL